MSDRAAAADAPELVERVLAAADGCFQRFGIAKTTMEDVARAASISRATLYRYFADRESLLTESVRRRARLNMKTARADFGRRTTIEDKITGGIISQAEDTPEGMMWVRRLVEHFVVPAITPRSR